MARTLSSTVGSIFDMVGTTADAITKTVEATANLADIYHAKTDTWRKTALITAAMEQATARKRVLETQSALDAARQKDLATAKQDKTFAKAYDEAHKEYDKILTDVGL